MDLKNYKTDRQHLIYLRDKGWSINALYTRFPSMDVEHILKEEGTPTPKITVTACTAVKRMVLENLDLDGDIIKPPKPYKVLLAECEARSKRMNKIANL